MLYKSSSDAALRAASQAEYLKNIIVSEGQEIVREGRLNAVFSPAANIAEAFEHITKYSLLRAQDIPAVKLAMKQATEVSRIIGQSGNGSHLPTCYQQVKKVIDATLSNLADRLNAAQSPT